MQLNASSFVRKFSACEFKVNLSKLTGMLCSLGSINECVCKVSLAMCRNWLCGLAGKTVTLLDKLHAPCSSTLLFKWHYVCVLWLICFREGYGRNDSNPQTGSSLNFLLQGHLVSDVFL